MKRISKSKRANCTGTNSFIKVKKTKKSKKVKKTNKVKEIKWLKFPEQHDYPAALSYLKLIFNDKESERFVSDLKKAKMTEFKAKDIFRASGLSLLGVSNSHV